MISKWQNLSLREAGISLIDCMHKTPEAKNDGYPYVAIPQMKDGRIDLSSARKISHDDFLEWTIKAKPETDDVILSRRCNPSESAYVPEGVEFALGQNLVLLRSDGKKVHKPYLRWLLNSPFWWAEIQKFMNVGAIFTSLKCADVLKFTLPIPPLDKQEKISEILYSIDTKIELNRQINQTLEAMAQAIFKSWFVDFEPVKAKIAAIEAGEDAEGIIRAAMSAISGKTDEELDQLQAEQPEHYMKLKTTAELFPAAMRGSELGEIPEEWEVKKLSDICTKVIDGTHDSPKPSEDGYYLVTGRNIVNGFIDFSKCYKISSEDHKKVIKRSKPEKGDIIFSNIGTLGSTVLVDQNFEFSIKNVALFKPLEGIYSRYLYLHFSSAQTQKLLIQKATGTTQIFFSLNFLRDLALITPPKYIISKFDEIVQPFFEERSLMNQANQNLCDLRDSLLPKLLSGELSVDAVKLAEEEGLKYE